MSPAGWAGQDILLQLGACDKADTTYFNGTPVGAIGYETKSCWNMPRVYPIRKSTSVRAGRNVIATRVYSNFAQGGLMGPARSMQLICAGTPAIPLARIWHCQVERDFGFIRPAFPLTAPPPGPGNWNTPHILYDSMVTPLVPAAIRGVIWDQGGSNVPQARHYGQLFPLLIRDWRRTFGQPDLPFYFVQLANFTAPQHAPVEGWLGQSCARRRRWSLREPHTGMVVGELILAKPTIFIRRTNKTWANAWPGTHSTRCMACPMACNGPLYRCHQHVEGDTIRIGIRSCRRFKN